MEIIINWLDSHTGAIMGFFGAITGIATVALAFITYYYVRLTGRESHLMRLEVHNPKLWSLYVPTKRTAIVLYSV